MTQHRGVVQMSADFDDLVENIEQYCKEIVW
jgi:hypothetical protein